MRTFRFPKLVPFLAAGVLTFGVACGDDDDDTGDDDVAPIDAAVDVPDAPVPDAGDPDAAELVSTRSGTVAVTDITLVDSAALEADWFSGAVVSVSYVPVPPVKAPAFDNIVPPGVGCSVTNFELGNGDALPVQQDEGTVTISGPGLLSPIGPCAIPTGGDSYLCLFGGGALAVGDTFTLNGDNQTATVSIAAATFDDTNDSEVGMFLSTSGFTDPTAGTQDLDPYNGEFPIVAVNSGTSVVVAFPTDATLPAGTITTASPFAVVSGAAPTPADRAFLDADSSVTIEKTAGNETEAIAQTTVTVGGDGFRMDDATLGLMRAMPIDSTTALSYSCAGAGGTCGTATGTVVSITATNGDISEAGPFDLPPGANIVSVSCRAFGDTVSVPVEVLDVLEGITPTRIQTTMFRADFGLAGNADGTNGTGMVAGTGYTKFGAAAE